MTTAAEKAVETDKTSAPDKRKALGRGLESLLPGGPRVVAGTAASPVAPGATSIVLPEIQAQAARAAGCGWTRTRPGSGRFSGTS